MWVIVEYRFLSIGNEIDKNGSEEQAALINSPPGNHDGLDTHDGEKWIDSSLVLNIELTVLANELGVEDDRRFKRG